MSRYKYVLVLAVCLLTLVALGSAKIAKQNTTCEVPKAPKCKVFKAEERIRYPTDAVTEALLAHPAITRTIDILPVGYDEYKPVVANPDEVIPDPTIAQCYNLCPDTTFSLYKHGVKDGRDKCWVIQPLWYATCNRSDDGDRCQHTITDVAYFRCRRVYLPMFFWAYCKPKGRHGELRLLYLHIPRYSECRRFFCPDQRQISLDPYLPPL